MDNAAFEYNPAREAADILHRMKYAVDAGKTEGPIVDHNGNTVGSWSIST